MLLILFAGSRKCLVWRRWLFVQQVAAKWSELMGLLEGGFFHHAR